MRHLYVDVTRTVQSGLHTGIQRVVRRLCQAQGVVGAQRGIAVHAVMCKGDQWFGLDQLPRHPLEGGTPLGSAEGVLPGSAACGPRVRPGPGDILLMADASWYLDPWPAVDGALRDGARLVGFVHDMLPLQQPQWFRAELFARFGHHFAHMAARASGLLAPSVVVAEAVQLRLDGLRGVRQAVPRVACQPLGADFLAGYAGADGAKAAVALPESLRAGSPFALMVGTIEPRKNHAVLLDAFETLWQAGHALQLVLVGAPGWCSEGLQARLRDHPERGRRLHWLSHQSDTQLHALYVHASALLAASLDEGFGLPLVEAAHLGCPVLASDIAVFREVGGDWPRYISPYHASDWVRALQQLPGRTDRVAPTCSWTQVATQLLATLDALTTFAGVPEPAAYV